MDHAPVPVPIPNPESVEFWEGCKREELLIQKCLACGRFRYFPREHCPTCSDQTYEWVQASGMGTLFSWIIVYPPTLPAFQQKVPYPVILVELEEGVRMISNIVDCDNEELRIGMPLQVIFEEVIDGVTLPKFRPV